jgi:glycosyltransferase involved in cell wall biosynthesis
VSARGDARDGVRVAFLNPCFWPEVRRGSERMIRELADGLIERGHHPRLITSHPGRPARSTEDGLPIVRHWRPPRSRLERRQFEQYLTHVPFSYLSLRTGADDLAHALYPTDALAAGRWTRRTGRPSILGYMGIPDHPGVTSRRLRTRITFEAASGCTAVTALSKTAAEAFWRWLGIEARVIHPGVDLSAFAPRADRAELPTLFCAAPPDVERKRVGLLISAFRLVRRERRDARLVLLRPRNPGLADRVMRTESGIELVDPVEDPAALAPRYGEAWASVLPSTGDSFGIVLIESLACGTPVVGSDRGAIPEVIDRDAIGRLFDGDERVDGELDRALARALLEALELAQDPATATACRARAEEFSNDRCVEAYLALYRELLDEA